MDMYDMKPEAPAEYRGFWRPIPTNVQGMEISELFPLQAKVADKFRTGRPCDAIQYGINLSGYLIKVLAP